MIFGGTLQNILHRVLEIEPSLGPFYLSTVDLTNAYMRLWVWLQDTPIIYFLIPKKQRDYSQLAGFHLSPQMGLRDSSPYFFIVTKTVMDLANASIA